MGVGECETSLEIQEGMVLLTCSCCCFIRTVQSVRVRVCVYARVCACAHVCVHVHVCTCVCVCVFRSSSGNNSVKNSGPATELGTRVEL